MTQETQKKSFVAVGALIALVALIAAPLIVFAAPSTLKELFALLINLINGLIAIVSALALLCFVWGMAQFILNADSEDGRTKGKNIMIWGIIALFVLFSIWGILAVLNNTFLNGGAGSVPTISPPAPTLPPTTGA